jgi:CHAD domain-containing protein
MAAVLRDDAETLARCIPLLQPVPSADGVHEARVAMRRLRSHLRTFGPVLDETPRRELSRRLGELASELAVVRDLDVLGETVDELARGLHADDEVGLATLRALVATRRHEAIGSMHAALDDERAVATVQLAIAFAAAPPIADRGDESARTVLTDLARRPWRQLERAAERRRDTTDAASLHELRILAKRARYAADAASAVRPSAARHARELARLQTALGGINDAAVAEHYLRSLAGADAEAGIVAGLLIAALRRRAERRRTAWTVQWDRARRKAVRGWLDSST